jgi:hypothetical protein
VLYPDVDPRENLRRCLPVLQGWAQVQVVGMTTEQLDLSDAARWVARVINAREIARTIDGQDGIPELPSDDEARDVITRHVARLAGRNDWVGQSVAHTSIYLAYLHRRFEFFGPKGHFYHFNFLKEDVNDGVTLPKLGSELYDAMGELTLPKLLQDEGAGKLTGRGVSQWRSRCCWRRAASSARSRSSAAPSWCTIPTSP